MNDPQSILVLLIVAAACVFLGAGVLRRVASFRKKEGCGTDCGCGPKEKIT